MRRPLARIARSRGAPAGLAQALVAAAVAACTTQPPLPRAPMSAPAPCPTAPPVAAPAPPERGWPEGLAKALEGRGDPHTQPVLLSPDARGRARWLAFVGTPAVAWGAWRVTVSADATEVEPVAEWPVGVRVLGAVVEAGVAYVLLESVDVLDQPPGMRAVWIDAAGGPSSPFEASPMALADVRTLDDLADRVKRRPPNDGDGTGLLAALRSASASTVTLASSLAREGADVRLAWQGLFAQAIGHLDADTASSSLLAGSVIAVMRDALATQACGHDACETWTDGARAIVRFVRQDGRWVVRAILEDAPGARSQPGASPPHQVATTGATETESLLRARARRVDGVLGQAPLTAGGGTIGVGLTDLAPGIPVVAVIEGEAAHLFPIEVSVVRAEGPEARWTAAFADVDGDGRTDVILRYTGVDASGDATSWTQAFVAPPPSVQASSLSPDLATALVLMDAKDMDGAAHAATSIAPKGVTREDACRLLADASTPAGFRRQAAPDARLLQFDEPGLPTWRPKVVSAVKASADDLRGLGAHCTELACNPTRPYCAWIAGADSEHLWFGWHDGRPEIVGAASYEGE